MKKLVLCIASLFVAACAWAAPASFDIYSKLGPGADMAKIQNELGTLVQASAEKESQGLMLVHVMPEKDKGYTQIMLARPADGSKPYVLAGVIVFEDLKDVKDAAGYEKSPQVVELRKFGKSFGKPVDGWTDTWMNDKGEVCQILSATNHNPDGTTALSVGLWVGLTNYVAIEPVAEPAK